MQIVTGPDSPDYAVPLELQMKEVRMRENLQRGVSEQEKRGASREMF